GRCAPRSRGLVWPLVATALYSRRTEGPRAATVVLGGPACNRAASGPSSRAEGQALATSGRSWPARFLISGSESPPSEPAHSTLAHTGSLWKRSHGPAWHFPSSEPSRSALLTVRQQRG